VAVSIIPDDRLYHVTDDPALANPHEDEIEEAAWFS
jgi:hypothetical protein